MEESSNWLSASEISRLLCPNPYTCNEGVSNAVVPQEICDIIPGGENLYFAPENYQCVALLSRCVGCDKLAVRRLNVQHRLFKVINYTSNGFADVPGAGVTPQNQRRNLFVDAMLYASQCLGVDSSKDFANIGTEMTVEDYNRTFPLLEDSEEEDQEATTTTFSSSSSNNNNKCSYCRANKGSDDLHRCKGSCGGIVQYCNAQCQKAHWKKGHKKECWKVATVNTFTIPNDITGRPDVPLRAVRKLDGFHQSGLMLYFSDHLGYDATIPHVVDIFGKIDDEMGWNVEGITKIMYSVPTSPVHNDVDRALLKPGEACFNISKNKPEFDALVQHGIIKITGKTLQIGMYPIRHPVCRINLPVDVEAADSDDDDDDDNEA